MRFGSAQVLTTGSMIGNLFSSGIDLQQEWIFSMQAIWSSVGSGSVSGLGTIKLQISNDNVPPRPISQNSDPSAQVQNWTDYSGSLNSTSATGGTSSFVWNVTYPGYRWVRMAYVAASGSGIMTVNYFGKGT